MPGIYCLFNSPQLIVLFYIDDIIVVYHERVCAKADKSEENMMKTYQTKPLGQIDNILGIQVIRDKLLRKV